jgi:serine phosphatase RsbU (regulator of sigma subunit)
MVMRLFCLYLVCFSFGLSQLLSQKINTDSLILVLDKINDPVKELTLLKTISDELSVSSLDKTIKYAKRGISLSQKLKKTADQSQFLYDIGVAYSYNNEFDKAGKYFSQSLKLRKALKDNEGVAAIYFESAYNFFYQNNYDSAKYYCNLTTTIAQQSDITEYLAKANYLLARVEQRLGNNKEAFTFLEKSLQYYEKNNNLDGKSKVLYSLGQNSYVLTNYDDAINYYKQALIIGKSRSDDRSSALLNYNIGNVYLAKGSFNEAMTSYQESLSFFEKSGNQEGVANCYNSIGLVYEKLIRNDDFKQNQYYFKNALKYYKMALDIHSELKNESELANSMMNLANIHARFTIDSLVNIYGIDWENYLTLNKKYAVLTRPLTFYEKALEIKTRLNDKNGIARNLNNLGNLYSRVGNYIKALNCLTESAEINMVLNNQEVLAMTYFEISRLNVKLKKHEEVCKYFELGTNLALKIGDKYLIKEFYKEQLEYFDKIGDCKKSMSFYKKFQALQDEIASDNTVKAVQELNTKYETEKKENEIKFQKSQIQQQKITIYSTALVLLLIAGIAVLLVKQNRERKRVNEKLEHQNEVITEQKQEITDSIRYASLIQTAAMPAVTVIEKYFSGSFVFFRPRDIVSGDFFWLKEINGKIIVAAADCTGHGVPGAFMSMLGISNLNNIVSTLPELHSDSILNEIRKMIIISLNQTGRSGENKDGMDISLYIYDPDKKDIEYSGANNPLVLIRNGEILETKANKMPIGIHERSNEPFTRNVIPVLPGDMIYTFSDGYADQFGGTDNRKFMSGNMKKMFASIASEPIDVQYKTIEKTNLDWRGDNYQVDDMIIIGVRI